MKVIDTQSIPLLINQELYKPKPEFTLQLQADGGCKGNPGLKYGSYEARLNGKIICQSTRFNLGHGTNNEAEFEAIENGLQSAHDELTRLLIDPWKVYCVVLTDSVIVRNRLMKRNRHRNYQNAHKNNRSEAMRVLTERCMVLLDPFQSFHVNWHSRENNVAAFGH